MKAYYRIRYYLVPLNNRHFAKLGGELGKGDFYLGKFIFFLKNLSQSKFKNLL